MKNVNVNGYTLKMEQRKDPKKKRVYLQNLRYESDDIKV